ncbi:MAG: hypothetical protein IT548_04925 [Alphaproteobacteria bacterium]|nr:hypothetical protein [Alphaproteobacteria bacterium]
MRHLLALAAFACLTAAAQGAEVTDTLPGRPAVTYEALLRQAMPDLARDGEDWTATDIPGLRYLSGEASEGGVTFSAVETAELKSDGRPVLALLTASPSGGGFSSVLALYDMTAPVPRLIDAVDAGLDRFTDLDSAIALSPDTGALVIDGWHDNSSESYDVKAFAFLHEHRITLILEMLAYGARTCGWMTTEQGRYDIRPDAGVRYAAIEATIVQETTRQAEDCGDDSKPLAPEGKQTFTDIYRWDEAKGAYTSATANLAKALGPE